MDSVRDRIIAIYNMDEEQAKRYAEFCVFMRAYELEKQLNLLEIKENIKNDD